MRVSIVADESALTGLRIEWETLWVACAGEYRGSFDFCRRAWTNVHRPRGSRLVVVTVRDDNGMLVLVLPLVVVRVGPLRLLRALGVGTYDECEVVAADDEQLATRLRAAWDVVVAEESFDIAALPVIVGTPLHDLLEEDRRTHVVERGVMPVAALSQESDWDSYAATLGELSGRKPGRVLRKLERQGVVRRRQLDPERDDVAGLVRWMLEEKQRWADDLGAEAGVWLESPDLGRFLVDAVRAQQEDRAPLVALVLEVDDRVVAAVLVGIATTSATGMFSAFDHDWADLRAGAACWEYAMQWALEAGLDWDFGYGGYRYKRYYSKGKHRVVDRLWTPHSVRGRLAVATLRRLSGLRAGWSGQPLDHGSEGATAWAAYAEGRRHK